MIGTTITLHDESAIPELQEEILSADDSPIFLMAAATEKGPEEVQLYDGSNFFVLNGNPNFKKFGQASIQAADIIKAGGRLRFKRIVADDATLANLIIVAKVAKKQVQKTNTDGELLYLTEEGEETNVAESNTPIMLNRALIRYEAHTVSDAGDFDTVKESADELLNTEGEPGVEDETGLTWFTYPLYTFADVGRGSSNKRVKFDAEYALCKRLNIMLYRLDILNENLSSLESTRFSIETDAEYNNENITITEVVNSYFNQIKAYSYEDNFDEFKAKVSEFSGMTDEELEDTAYLFGKTKKKVNIESIIIDTERGIDLTADNGFALLSGSDGAFEKGITSTEGALEYEERLLEFFSGEYDDNIYNPDVYKFVACIDAVYPDSVKRKIEELAEFRKDFFFYQDTKFAVKNIYDLELEMEKVADSIYTGVYFTTYDVKDTYSKKQIKVTMLYEMAPLLVNHYTNNPGTIFAGFRYNAVLSRAIKGTLNFIPKILPYENQKEKVEELRANYAYYYDNDLIVESGWTSQSAYTQLSFIHNVNAILTVLRALTEFFPKNRYANISTTNLALLEEYTSEINEYIDEYSNMFEELTFEYVQDKIAVANKIYKAIIKFRFKDFEQTEQIDAYALPTLI